MISKNFLISIFILLFLIPLVSAEITTIDNPRPPFDLFYLFVELTFGNIIFAGFGIAGIIAFICIIGRMSNLSMIFIVGTFLAVYFMGALSPILVGLVVVLSSIFYLAKSWGLLG